MAKTEKIEKIFKKNCKKNLEVQKKLLPLQSQNRNAEVAQLVEHNLAKVGVASSSLVFRSKASQKSEAFFFLYPVQKTLHSFS